jgi:hypothetical protein
LLRSRRAAIVLTKAEREDISRGLSAWESMRSMRGVWDEQLPLSAEKSHGRHWDSALPLKHFVKLLRWPIEPAPWNFERRVPQSDGCPTEGYRPETRHSHSGGRWVTGWGFLADDIRQRK